MGVGLGEEIVRRGMGGGERRGEERREEDVYVYGSSIYV